MTTPYVLPAALRSFPTGVQWSSIPSANSTPDVQDAAQLELCRAASHWADAECGMPLRATADTEELLAPGDRATPDSNGVLWLKPLRKPVRSVLKLEGRPNTGRTSDYIEIDAESITLLTNAGVDELASGSGTSRIRVTGTGIVRGMDWGSWSLRLQYVNGWANSELSAATAIGDTSLTVADATGFSAGDTIDIVDTYQSEQVTITAIDGTILTVSALTFAHAAGTQVTELPANIRTAAAWYAAHLALFRGSAAMAIPVASARRSMASGGRGEIDYLQLAQMNLAPYRRVW